MMSEKKAGLELLREPFPEHQISKLPKPTKAQTEAVRADYKKGIRCKICGGWHHPDVIHLDYVGHAALTDRLLDCDPQWSWEPVSFDANGSPFIDNKGGLWIRLTVCNVTRLGYGHPDGKQGGDAVKEAIGDALRNAAMRFGAALDLWHRGDLHAAGGEPEEDPRVKKWLGAIDRQDTKEKLAQLTRHETWLKVMKELDNTPAKEQLLDAVSAKDAALDDVARQVNEIMNGGNDHDVK